MKADRRATGGELEGCVDGEDGAALSVLYEVSRILNTGLDKTSLQILLQLLDHGVHPEALANVVLELDRELREVREKERAGEERR